ncbi:MAG TPA: nucleotide exchange factor GrpE [Bacteroidales bacterium]|nr:nucleotide exchange factor GrpE [Bacteroidales bacterium]HRW84670.1 nucleotide exchange factor GrpE [Bacteroidales bacterium]
MVKKKNSDNEAEKHTDNADNKPDSQIKEDTEQTESAAPPAGEENGEEEVPSGGEEKSTDKVVREEKSFEEKLAEMQDRYLRLSAEFDNYRKRTLREKMELSKFAAEELLVKILPVMDDFDRALSHMDSATDSAAMKSGIELIYGKLVDFLHQNGVKAIETTDADFNVDLHDAVAKTAVEQKEKKGKIVDVVLKGYYLNDKVIRHAKVVIGE